MIQVVFLLFVVMTSTYAQKNPHKNITIGTSYEPNEPTIAIHPKDPNILLGGSNIFNLYRSEDGGKSWEEKTLRSTYGVWGDPVIIADTAGNFYFFHLSNPEDGNWIDRIVCQKTEDNGKSWTNGSYMGLNGTKAQDKHWAVVDPRTNYIYVTWTQFDKYGSTNPNDKSSIMFSMSKDEAKTWTTAKKINEVDGDCIDSDNTTEGAVPAIGPNGELYVAWAGPQGLVFDRSLDGGKTWLDKDVLVDPMPSGWDYAVPGIYRCNGLPITACDISGGAHNGTVYINWTDQRNGADDTDVWLAKSEDQGKTWSKPIRVNNDKPGNQQFFTWMTVDQTTGYLYFVFYDRRGLKGEQTNVYMARSIDGGQTFVNFKINDKPFYPNKGIFFGDYNNIAVQGDVIRPIWTRLDDMQLSIKTAIVDITAIPDKNSQVANVTTPELEDTTKTAVSPLDPNTLFISFKIPKKSKLTLHLYNEKGRRLKPIFRCKSFEFGKHIEKLNIPDLKLKKGNYTYQLKHKRKILKERKFEVL
ncbi:sialidase family protein [Aureispira anguillae]|uniref:Glycoside hydrolase n=1 Tax=Aureispira anguillae TaxID=2864201 RepID=A0A915VKE9_9BACT|nr:sialidase family protein [Aureispira anguillae]BDS09663.1 glycoside hydrolase [Aureispira anguillae]